MPLTEAEELELLELEELSGGVDPQTDPDMFQRMGEDISQRAQDAVDIKRSYQAGEISKPEEIFQLTGKAGAGVIGDIGGELIKSGVDLASQVDEATGGYIGSGLTGITSAIGSLPSMAGGTIGERLPQEIAVLSEQYGEFAEQNPRAATNIEATANLALLSPVLKYGEDMIDAAGNIKKGMGRSKISKISSEDLRKRGGELFKEAEVSGGAVKPEFWDDFAKDIGKIAPTDDLRGAMTGEGALEKALEGLRSIQGKTNSLETIKTADEILGELAENSININGKYNPDGRKFIMMQQALRDRIDKAPAAMFEGGKEGFESVKEARKFWAASNRLDDVERIISKAEGVEQPTTVIRNGFKRIRDNPKKMKYYSPEEQFAIKKAAKTGLTGSFLKLTGSGLVPIIAGTSGAAVSGGIAGGAAAIPAFAVQQAAKRGAEALQKSRGALVEDAIKKGVMPDIPRNTILQPLGALSTSVGRSTRPMSVINAMTQETSENGSIVERARKLFGVDNSTMKREE